MKVGYARVSSQDQDYSYQLKALEDAGCQPDMLFRDKASGKRMSRPEFDRMLTYLREGDVVVVWKIDRLGRNFTEMVDRKSTRLNSSHHRLSRMPSSA